LSLEAASSEVSPFSPDFRPERTSRVEIECHFTFQASLWKEGNYGNCSYSFRKWSMINDYSSASRENVREMLLLKILLRKFLP
jgi:hypothetical protein